MPELNGEWIDHGEIEIRIAEGWKRVLVKINGTADALDSLSDVADELRKSISLVGDEFESLRPLLDALSEEDDEPDEYGRDDVEDMEG